MYVLLAQIHTFELYMHKSFDFNSYISTVGSIGFTFPNSYLHIWKLWLSVVFQDFISIGENKKKIYQDSACQWTLRIDEVIKETKMQRCSQAPYESRGIYW